MTAKELVNALISLIEEHGDMEILIPDEHDRFYDTTVAEVGHLKKSKNHSEAFYMQLGRVA